MPCTKYATSTLQSLSLSALIPGEYVAGGFLCEQPVNGETETVLHVQVVKDQECNLEDSDPLTGMVTHSVYVVSTDAQGGLVLTELD